MSLSGYTIIIMHFMELKNFNTYFFFSVLFLVSAGAFYLFAPFLSAIFVAALLAAMFVRPYEFLVRLLRQRRSLAAGIACFIVIIVIILPIVGIGRVVGGEIVAIVENVTTDGSRQQETMTALLTYARESAAGKMVLTQVETTDMKESLVGAIKSVGDKVGPILTKTYQSVAGGILWIFVMFFSLFYFFIDGKKFVQKIMHLSPLKNHDEEMLMDKFVSMARATLRGTFIIGSVQGGIGGLAFLVAGVSSPMLWTVVMIFLAIIPALGASLIIFPAGVIMLFLGHIWQGIFLLIVGAVVASIDNVMRPKIVGSDTKMHSLLVFFATIGGMSVFGLIGFIVGPIIMALAIAMWEIYALEFKEQLKDYNT